MMRPNNIPKTVWAATALMTAALLVSGCASQKPGGALAGNGVGNGMRAAGVGYAKPGSSGDFSQNVGNRVLFTTDSTSLTAEAKSILQAQARWLRQYPNYVVTVEGHADERGTREYNLGLAARRAMTVKNFLIRQGISAQRIKTISYGKERPVATCDNISCWSQNRRAVTALSGAG